MNSNNVQSFPATASQTLTTGTPVKLVKTGTIATVTKASAATGNIGVVIGDYKTGASDAQPTAVAVQLFSGGCTALIKIKTGTSCAVGASVIVDGDGYKQGSAAYDKGSAVLLEDGTTAGDVVRAVFV